MVDVGEAGVGAIGRFRVSVDRDTGRNRSQSLRPFLLLFGDLFEILLKFRILEMII